MEEKDRKAKRSELLRELIGMYQPESAGEVSTMLRDLFAGTMEDMLKAEMDAKLGYHKNDPAPKGTENRRNGSYPKTVRSGMSRILCKRQIETISNIVDLVQPRVTEWQTRKLDRGKERNASIKA